MSKIIENFNRISESFEALKYLLQDSVEKNNDEIINKILEGEFDNTTKNIYKFIKQLKTIIEKSINEFSKNDDKKDIEKIDNSIINLFSNLINIYINGYDLICNNPKYANTAYRVKSISLASYIIKVISEIKQGENISLTRLFNNAFDRFNGIILNQIRNKNFIVLYDVGTFYLYIIPNINNFNDNSFTTLKIKLIQFSGRSIFALVTDDRFLNEVSQREFEMFLNNFYLYEHFRESNHPEIELYRLNEIKEKLYDDLDQISQLSYFGYDKNLIEEISSKLRTYEEKVNNLKAKQNNDNEKFLEEAILKLKLWLENEYKYKHLRVLFFLLGSYLYNKKRFDLLNTLIYYRKEIDIYKIPYISYKHFDGLFRTFIFGVYNLNFYNTLIDFQFIENNDKFFVYLLTINIKEYLRDSEKFINHSSSTLSDSKKQEELNYISRSIKSSLEYLIFRCEKIKDKNIQLSILTKIFDFCNYYSGNLIKKYEEIKNEKSLVEIIQYEYLSLIDDMKIIESISKIILDIGNQLRKEIIKYYKEEKSISLKDKIIELLQESNRKYITSLQKFFNENNIQITENKNNNLISNHAIEKQIKRVYYYIFDIDSFILNRPVDKYELFESYFNIFSRDHILTEIIIAIFNLFNKNLNKIRIDKPEQWKEHVNKLKNNKFILINFNRYVLKNYRLHKNYLNNKIYIVDSHYLNSQFTNMLDETYILAFKLEDKIKIEHSKNIGESIKIIDKLSYLKKFKTSLISVLKSNDSSNYIIDCTGTARGDKDLLYALENDNQDKLNKFLLVQIEYEINVQVPEGIKIFTYPAPKDYRSQLNDEISEKFLEILLSNK